MQSGGETHIAPDRIIRVGVAEDHPAARQGLVELLGTADDILVVGEAGDGEEALELAGSASGEPDVLLVDVRLPGMDGLEVTRRLSEDHPDVGVVILTAYDDPAYATEALRAGAKGYVLKTSASADVLETVRMVAHGHAVFDIGVWDALMEQWREVGERQGLTAPELDVLLLLAKGYTNREIADRLAMPPGTVRRHLERIFKLLEAASRTDAVIKAIRLGIIE